MEKVSILLFGFLSLLACKNKHPHADPFYTDKREYDMSRYPLIKPYEMITAIPSNDWMIQPESTDTSEFIGNVTGTKNVNVVDSVIFAYSKNTIIEGQIAYEGWFVVIPKHGILREFKLKKDYLKYLDSIKVKSPKMYDVEEVFHYFDKNDTLDWKKLNLTY